jgi:hypothetical protein
MQMSMNNSVGNRVKSADRSSRLVRVMGGSARAWLAGILLGTATSSALRPVDFLRSHEKGSALCIIIHGIALTILPFAHGYQASGRRKRPPMP